MDTLEKGDSHPREDGVGLSKILLCYSEWLSKYLFRKIPIGYFQTVF